MGGIPFPVDFGALCVQGVTYMGAIVSGLVGIFAMVSLMNMGVKWVRSAFVDVECEAVTWEYTEDDNPFLYKMNGESYCDGVGISDAQYDYLHGENKRHGIL